MELIRKVFFRKSSNTLVQFFRYGFVAVASLAVDFGVLVLLKEVAGFPLLVAASISFVLGLATNYFLSVRWVFHSSKIENKKKEIIFFAVIGAIGLVLTDIILWLLTHKVGLYYMVSKAIAVMLVYFWNFGMRKYYLFN